MSSTRSLLDTPVVPRPPKPEPARAIGRGVALLVGGLVVILAIEPIGPKLLYWMPLIIGLTYLVSSAIGGRSGGLWVPGFIVTGWGLAVLAILSGSLGDAGRDFAPGTLIGIGVGAVLAVLVLPRLRIPCNPLAVAVVVLAIGVLEQFQFVVGGATQDAWPWGVLLVLGGLWELRPSVTRP